MKRVTVRDIAKVSGYAPTTVSKVMRGKGNLPNSTREKIKMVADELGYVPHPGINALMKEMREHRKTERKWTAIAYIHDWENEDQFNDSILQPKYLDGARKRAIELGFQLEVFCYSLPSYNKGKAPSLSRVLQMIYARGIRAIIVAPRNREAHPFPLDQGLWENFNVAALMQIGNQRTFHCACPDYFNNIKLAYSKLWEKGARRIGLYILDHMDIRTHGRILGGFLDAQWRSLGEGGVPLLVKSHWDKDDLKHWLHSNRIDGVISQADRIKTWIEELGFSLPQDVLFSMISTEPNSLLSGVLNDPERLARNGIDLVYGFMQNETYGIPDHPVIHQTQGIWYNASTTPS